MDRLKEVFDLLDENNLGTIDIKDLSRGVRGVGLNPSEGDIRTLLSVAETDDNGELDFPEFKRLCDRCREIVYISREEVKNYLVRFDHGNKGSLNPEELKKALVESGEQLEDHEVDAVLQDFQKDGMGRISIEVLTEGLFCNNLNL